MANSETAISVLGLGRMGRAMAQKLVSNGFAVTGWSRSGRTLQGVRMAPTPRDAAEQADVVLLALYDTAACRSVLTESLAAMPADCVVVNTATVSPAEALTLQAITQEQARSYLHCPILGSVPAVETGAVTLLVGDAEPPQAIAEVLSALGGALHCDDAASAASLKLVANSVLADCVVALGDAVARARRLELDHTVTLDVLQRTVLSGLTTAKRARLEGTGGTADFTAEALAKDLGLLASIDPPSADLASSVKEANVPGAADIAAISTHLAATRCRPLDVSSNLYSTTATDSDSDLLTPLISYARGHATGEPKYFHDAFRPTARIEGVRGDQFHTWNLETFCGNFTGQSADDEHSRIRTLTALRRTGSVASATMLLQHGSDTFTDMFLLIREGSLWKIANKAYHREST